VKGWGASLLALAASLPVALGCATYERGRLAMASVRKIEAPFRIIKQDAQGTSCGSMFDARYEQAVQDALARSPGANALVGASWYFEKFCITVRGTAVYFPQPIPTGIDGAGDDPGNDEEPGETRPGDSADEASAGDDHADSAG
jgi:hypothetical protein